ncbi:MAG TPA: tRNA (adenosine(37)-N6)-dimethylallyltransferase MiaA [Solirubrobacteraceae bacterium]|nr:tRNA (adenosine(37)-N6)-dimethylallyltransferase MiaA [Solirubrobacteraceae bacterium]
MPAVHVIAIFGPTGVGKSAVALALARRLRARGEDPVAVSADALQIYRGLEILTGAADALATGDELEHRLIACVPLQDSFSVGRFAALAHTEIDALLEAGRRPIVVGGTGLYLRAALSDLDLKPPVAPALRAEVMARLHRGGPQALHDELAARRPDLAARVSPGDSQRLTRLHELLLAGIEPAPPPEEQLWTGRTRHPTLLAGLTLQRNALYARIDARVAAMVAAGAVEEVRAAAAAGAGPSARKAVGFRELLAGDVEAMAQRSRQYARRQLTWMRKLPDVLQIDLTHQEPDQAASRILAALDAASLPDR